MKAIRGFLAVIAALVILICAAVSASGESTDASPPQTDDYFTERDLSGYWDASAKTIYLLGDTAETSSHVVSVEDGIITILDGGTYVLTGTLNDGSIVVDVKDDERVQLVLNGVSITSSSSAAIRVIQADKVFITLAEGTENTLANGGAFDEGSEVDAVVFSDEDLTFNGTGTLTILSPTGNGIDGKDDIKFVSGTYYITAGNRGVNANDSIRILGGTFTVESGSDAFRADHDSKESLGFIYIWGGSFNITAGGGAVNGKSTAGIPGMPDMNMDFGTPPAEGERPEMPEGFDPSSDENRPEPPDGSGNTDGMTPPEIPEGTEGEMPQMPQGMTPGQTVETEETTVEGKGFKASGDLILLGGEFALDTASDAFHADGDLTVYGGVLLITSGDDGLHADGNLTILDGTVRITQSVEGLEAEVILISGGNISVVSSDDGLNARSSTGEKETFDAQEGVEIRITGGILNVNAAGDGIDSNGDLVITGGTVTVSGPTMNANGAIDYNGSAVISGGTLIAACASGMAENLSDTSTQPAFLVNLTGDAGEVTVCDSSGNIILTGTVEKNFGVLVISCADLTIGETYTVTAGENSAEITLTNMITGSDADAMAGDPMPGQTGGPKNERSDDV